MRIRQLVAAKGAWHGAASNALVFWRVARSVESKGGQALCGSYCRLRHFILFFDTVEGYSGLVITEYVQDACQGLGDLYFVSTAQP